MAGIAFGELLRGYREAAGLSQEEVAERAGLSTDAVSLLERGGRQRPHRDTVERLSAALALSPEEQARFAAARRPSQATMAGVGTAAGPFPQGAENARDPGPTPDEDGAVAGDPGSRALSPPPAPPAQTGNPFFHRGPVRDPAYFFGRTRETRFLADLLRQGQSVAITGPRRLGKTSLLFHGADPPIAAAHGLRPEVTRWIYLDGGSLDGLGEEWLYGAIDSALGGQDDAVPYPRLVARLQSLTAEGVRVILALDEFELVAANPQFGLAVFNRLRGLAARFALQMVTASRDPLLDLTVAHPETLSSPFFNIFAPLTLPLFTQDEALELLTILAERGGRPMGERTRAWLLDEAGPHPLFLQVAGYRAFAALDKGRPERDLAEEARATVRTAIAADLDQHLRYYWHALDADARYTLAALPLLDPEHRSPARDHLTAAGLLQGGGYLGRALEDFVRRQVVEGLLQAGPVVMDERRGLATVRGVPVHLTPTEFAALRLFLERRGQVITPREIEAALWPGEFVDDPERARGVVKKLRGALGDAADVLVNRRGHGYLLATE